MNILNAVILKFMNRKYVLNLLLGIKNKQKKTTILKWLKPVVYFPK